jgi:hypothetical protein
MVLDREERPRGGGEDLPVSTLSWRRVAGLGRTGGGDSRTASGAGRRSGQGRWPLGPTERVSGEAEPGLGGGWAAPVGEAWQGPGTGRAVSTGEVASAGRGGS